MTFHPDHMRAGIHAAMNSPNTPAHLKPHLAKRLQGAAPMSKTMMPGTMPMKNVATAQKPVKNAGKAGKGKTAKQKPGVPTQPKPILPPAFYGR